MECYSRVNVHTVAKSYPGFEFVTALQIRCQECKYIRKIEFKILQQRGCWQYRGGGGGTSI